MEILVVAILGPVVTLVSLLVGFAMGRISNDKKEDNNVSTGDLIYRSSFDPTTPTSVKDIEDTANVRVAEGRI